MNKEGVNTKESGSCSSARNYNRVYNYISSCMERDNKTSFEFGGYEISITDSQQLSFRKKGYTFGVAGRDEGIRALMKNKNDNDAVVDHINNTFCTLLNLIDTAS